MELKKVDIDLINELRMRGMNDKATELIKAFRKNIKDNKKQLIKEDNNNKRKIKKIIGYCSNLRCNNKTKEGSSLCERCFKIQLKSRMSNKCIDCNKLIDKRSLRCRSCSAKQLYSEGKIMKK